MTKKLLMIVPIVASLSVMGCTMLMASKAAKRLSPPPMTTIHQYVGMTEKTLLDKVGTPDRVVTSDKQKVLHYAWHHRDAVRAPQHEAAWRSNTVFTQRTLPTQAVPLRAACDMAFTIRNGKVAQIDANDMCW